MFAFSVSLAVSAQKRGALSTYKNLKPHHNATGLLEQRSNFSNEISSDVNYSAAKSGSLTSKKRGVKTVQDTSRFFAFKRAYSSPKTSNIALQSYYSADSIEIATCYQIIPNINKSSVTYKGMTMQLVSANKKAGFANVDVKVYDKTGATIAKATQKVAYSATSFGLYHIMFESPLTTSEDVHVSIEPQTANDSLYVSTSGAYRNSSIASSIVGNKMKLISPAPNTNLGTSFWNGQEVTGSGIPSGTKIVSYNSATKEYTLSQVATDAANVVVSGVNLTFDNLKYQGGMKYYKFPVVSGTNEPDFSKQPVEATDAIHWINTGTSNAPIWNAHDAHIAIYPIVEYSYAFNPLVDNKCLGNSKTVNVSYEDLDGYSSVVKNPVLNQMAFYTAIMGYSKKNNYYYSNAATKSGSFKDTIDNSNSKFTYSYTATTDDKVDTLVITDYMMPWGLYKTSGIMAANQRSIILSPKINLATTADSAKNKSSVDGKAAVVATGGITPYTYLWSNNSFKSDTVVSAGKYSIAVTDSNGCSAIDTVIVPFAVPSTSKTEITSCDKFDWNGKNYIESGVYTYEALGYKGNDSIATLVLTINKSDKVTLTEVACGSFDWNASTYTVSGAYVFNGKNAKGCDSIVTLNLTINQPTVSTINDTACVSYTWKDSTFTESGIYTLKTINAKGCDSTITLNLTVNQPSASEVTLASCDSLKWNKELYTASGTYTFTTTNAKGCDSIVTLKLTINKPTTSSTSHTANNSYTWNGTTYENSGIYKFNTTNAKSCDSTATLVLTVNAPGKSTTTITSCDSYRWNDSTYTSTGTHVFKTIGSQGNDSTATLLLTINTSDKITLEKVACGSFEWNDSTYAASGTYVFNGKNAKGCDSIVTLKLTINQPSASTETKVACGSFTWKDSTYTTSGSYTFKTINAKGCDSIVTLNLTINQPSVSILNETVCGSYIWKDSTFAKSGVYTLKTLNAKGCDSTITLNLTVNQPFALTVTETACGSYTWKDSTYTTSGSYTFKTKNTKGCDSIVTLNLTVNQPSASTVTETACGSYTWKDSTFAKSGVYTLKTLNAKGCDSTITLNLTVNQPSASTETKVACGSFDWNGKNYTTSGSYEFKTTNAKGCDSIATLNLTISQPSASTVTEVACGSFDWKGTKYEKSGSYTFKTTNAKGCDSIVTLNLTINTIPSVTASLQNGSLAASTANATYQWVNCDANNVAVANETKQTFLPTQTGNYAVKVTTKGCEATSACVKFEKQTTGLEDANQVAFSIYPNPNQGVFNIAGLPTGTYKILNLMGAEVFQFTVESTDAQLLNLSHLAKGVYQVTSDAVKIMHNKVVITD